MFWYMNRPKMHHCDMSGAHSAWSTLKEVTCVSETSKNFFCLDVFFFGLIFLVRQLIDFLFTSHKRHTRLCLEVIDWCNCNSTFSSMSVNSNSKCQDCVSFTVVSDMVHVEGINLLHEKNVVILPEFLDKKSVCLRHVNRFRTIRPTFLLTNTDGFFIPSPFAKILRIVCQKPK